MTDFESQTTATRTFLTKDAPIEVRATIHDLDDPAEFATLDLEFGSYTLTVFLGSARHLYDTVTTLRDALTRSLKETHHADH